MENNENKYHLSMQHLKLLCVLPAVWETMVWAKPFFSVLQMKISTQKRAALAGWSYLLLELDDDCTGGFSLRKSSQYSLIIQQKVLKVSLKVLKVSLYHHMLITGNKIYYLRPYVGHAKKNRLMKWIIFTQT